MAAVSIRDLARVCGVAVSTVSRAMNDRPEVSAETKARVREAAKQLGYVPNPHARSLKLSRLDAVGVIIRGETGQLLLQMLNHLEERLSQAGYATILSHVSSDGDLAAAVARIVDDGKYCGVVFLGGLGEDAAQTPQQFASGLGRLRVPTVFCTTSDHSGSRSGLSSVSVDDRMGGYAITRHLVDLGHRAIAFAGAGATTESGSPWALRYRGHCEALAEAGVAHSAAMAIRARNKRQLYTMQAAYDATRAWLPDAPEFTAIVASCDETAIGVCRALHEAGVKVPDDCSVTGFDGLDISRFVTPTLTTIRQPLAEIAQKTVEVLVSSLSQSVPSREQIWIQGALSAGESTAAPPPRPARPRTDDPAPAASPRKTTRPSQRKTS